MIIAQNDTGKRRIFKSVVPEGGGKRAEFQGTRKDNDRRDEQLFSFRAGSYVTVCYSSGNVTNSKSLRSRLVVNPSAARAQLLGDLQVREAMVL